MSQVGDDAAEGLRSSVLTLTAGTATVGLAVVSAFAEFEPQWIRFPVACAAAVCLIVFIAIWVHRFSVGAGLAFLVALMAIVTAVSLTVQPRAIGTITGFVFLGIAVSVAAIETPRVALPFDVLAIGLGVVSISLRSSIPLVAGGVLLAVTALSVFVVIRFRIILQKARDHAVAQSMSDPLTGLVNRRGLEAGVDTLGSLADRTGQLLGILILDLDHFKRINDRFGHDVGDQTLREFARTLRSEARKGDLVARLGGEEFAVFTIVPDESVLTVIGERLRQRVEASSAVTPITVSIGGAAVPGGQGFELRAVMSVCDRALYEAKSAGRNTVRVARMSGATR